MQTTKKYIDVFVNIIDNFGDMGFVLEFCLYYQKKYNEKYFFHIFCNDPEKLSSIFAINSLHNCEIFHIDNWKKYSDIAISFLHADFPKYQYREVLRVDYISFDKKWLTNNGNEHILSNSLYKITECIPSVFETESGILPLVSYDFDKKFLQKKYGIFENSKKYISIFVYDDTLAKIDFENIPNNSEIILFGAKNFAKKSEKIHIMPFISADEMYAIMNFSNYIITRGEISFMQVLQMWKPFLWDIYHNIGGFPKEQSEDFLNFLNATEDYKNFCKKLWNNNSLITISELIEILDNNKNIFKKRKYKNICEEIKKYLDKF